MKTTTNQLSKNSLLPDLEKFNILYVDDEQPNLNIFKSAFRKNYNLFSALTGAEALKVLAEEKIHLIITDQRMNDMDGIDLLKAVTVNHPEIIKIMLSGYQDIEVLVKAVNEVKIDKYLTKPWDRKQLQSVMDEELEKLVILNEPVSIHQHDQGMNKGNRPNSNPLSGYFSDSFEINHHTEGLKDNFQWVGQSRYGHKIIIMVNTMFHQNNDAEIKKNLAEEISIMTQDPDCCNQKILSKISTTYKALVANTDQQKNDGFDLSICAVFIHEKNDTIQYFSNYHGIKLFDYSLNEYEDGLYSGFYRLSAVHRLFVFSSRFNAHCLGELTYSQLINESIEMDLERQGHFLEMEIISSHLTEFNVSLLGVELKNKNLKN